MFEQALTLARRGFWIFPIKANEKAPPLVKFKEAATREETQIHDWWRLNPDANIGIYTGRFGDDEALLVIDVDNKGDKKGDDEILRLELEGKEFPATYVQTTPTGGRHLAYRVPVAVKQGVNVLGSGLDIRSRGGFIVGAGSSIGGKQYLDSGGRVVEAPGWLIEACADTGNTAPDVRRTDSARPVPPESAIRRATGWLEESAPISIEGSGGDATAYTIACGIRDYGVAETEAVELLLDHWNERCSPPWTQEELEVKVKNAYSYAQNAPGVRSPESVFGPVESNISSSSGNSIDVAFTSSSSLARFSAYSYLVSGDSVLWSTTDSKGRAITRHLSIGSFTRQHAAHRLTVDGGKTIALTKLWMDSAERPTYEAVVFAPEGNVETRFFNVWRGFAVIPSPITDMHPSVNQWLEHLRENICRADKELANWLIGYFAHMVQRPGEKPLVALVFRGGKGVGKNALVTAVGSLFSGHYLLTSNRRYLVGNFNAHLENLLFFVLDEAFWSGDKQAEGTLKDLITGEDHLIERKGEEPYPVRNLTRIGILGNADWIVPASHDERRFAVFNVGDGRKKDLAYFERLKDGMADGGRSALLRYLLDYDISRLNFNDAPASVGLLEQKHESLEPFAKWWLECLHAGALLGGEFDSQWPERLTPERFRASYRSWSGGQRITARLPTQILKALNEFAPSVESKVARIDKGVPQRAYILQSLDKHRAEWNSYIGHTVQWSE